MLLIIFVNDFHKKSFSETSMGPNASLFTAPVCIDDGIPRSHRKCNPYHQFLVEFQITVCHFVGGLSYCIRRFAGSVIFQVHLAGGTECHGT